MENKKIAIIRPLAHIIDPDSYNCQEIGLARGLAAHGVDTDVFLAGAEKKVCKNSVTCQGPGRVRVFQLPFITLPEIAHAIYPSLRGLLIRGKYDLIHVNEENEITTFLVARLGKKLRTPVIIYQGMYQPLTGRIRMAFQKFYDIFLLPTVRRNIHCAVAKTTTAEQFLKSKGFAKTAVIPVGLDPSPFANAPEINWHQRLGIATENRIVLYVGVFEERRNIDFLLEVARRCRYPGNITFVFVGSGPELEKAQDRIAKQDLPHVLLPGRLRQQELPSLYKQSDLFLLASNYEIYGMVVLEAMYFGVPVISTMTAGPRDIIQPGEDGILMERLDAEQWAKTVLELLQTGSFLPDMKKRAREKIENELIWERVAAINYLRVNF